MTEHVETPWHFWPMLFLTVLWQGCLATGYVLWRIEHPAWIGRFPPDFSGFLDELPLWAELVWALAVWAGLLGALLMVGRVAGAALALAIGFLGLLGLMLGLFVLPPGLPAVAGRGHMALFIAAVAVSAGLWAYAREQKQAGVLD
ncbi:hypothetical protein ACFQXB_11750 [Plastorhodobacter daqingensis]|uniref:DoxX-like family protein n=1 Tax=Plastorhodobacter daqingensis TaxID=1387281 RepID=A0ABW2ULD0_9RHOB